MSKRKLKSFCTSYIIFRVLRKREYRKDSRGRLLLSYWAYAVSGVVYSDDFIDWLTHSERAVIFFDDSELRGLVSIGTETKPIVDLMIKRLQNSYSDLFPNSFSYDSDLSDCALEFHNGVFVRTIPRDDCYEDIGSYYDYGFMISTL